MCAILFTFHIFQDAVRQLKKEEAWLLHSNEENLTVEIKNTLDEVQEKYNKLNETFSNADSFKNKIREVMAQVNAEISSNKEELVVDNDQFNANQETLKKISEGHQNSFRMQNKAKQKLDRYRDDIGQLETEITEREGGYASEMILLNSHSIQMPCIFFFFNFVQQTKWRGKTESIK